MGGRGIRALVLALAIAGSGCALGERHPAVLTAAVEDGAPRVRILDLRLGEPVRWTLVDGSAGEGVFMGLEGDSLIVGRTGPRGLARSHCRVAVAELATLEQEPRERHPVLSAFVGVPLVLGSILIAVIAIGLRDLSGS